MDLRLRLGCFSPAASVIVAALLLASSASAAYEVTGAWVTVYRDGVARVKVAASVDETDPSVTIPLLSSSVVNVLAVDEEGEVLDYEVAGLNITIYTLGAARVTLEYDTGALTRKEAGLWTVSFTAPFNLTLLLPEGSTIIYINSVPESIGVADGRIRLVLSKGYWEVSYEVPVATPPPPPPPALAPPQPPVGYLIGGGVAAAAAILAALAIKRRGKGFLGEEREREVIALLKKRGGRALEAELREALPHIPKTTMWRLLRRLEKAGRVRIRKVGLQNLVELS
ncbi:MAG: hypothetical protein N3H31_05050 [Candidatus Nezhaarchaeota archaeon]|nr:hypothetical protein [Candidatus Nezhaarchaeota archaeon]